MKEFAEKLEAIVDTAGLNESSKIIHIEVQHDRNCPALHSRCLEECICRPEIKS